MHVIVASKNPVKIQATEMALKALWPERSFTVSGIAVPSGVAEQPVGEEETLRGARNRTRNAHTAAPEANLWVGLEGGVVPHEDGYLATAWMVVWDGVREGTGRTASFPLPPAVSALLDQGLELGEADDRIFGTSNSKQSRGAVGLLTNDAITRATLYAPAVMMALIPFLKEELYPV